MAGVDPSRLLIDRRQREGLDFDESAAIDRTQKPALRAIPPQAVIRPQSQRSLFGCNPLGAGAAQPPPGRTSSRLTARLARIWQARRLPRCRDSAPCFLALCAREAAAPLSACPFSYISAPPWSVAWNACHRPSYQAQRSRPKNGRFGHTTAGSTGAAAFGPG